MQQSSGLQAFNFIKKRLQHKCFLVNIPKILGTAFFIEQFWWLLFNYVLVSERILKKESLWRDCLWFNYLVSCTNTRTYKQVKYHKKICLSCKNLLNFIITKYLKQEVHGDLSICMDERSPYGLSMTGDIKIYQCLVIKR